MPTQAEVVWDPGFTRYDFGPTHPMSPVRLDLTARLCDAFGLFDRPDVHRLDPAIASDALLETVHSAGLRRRRAGRLPRPRDGPRRIRAWAPTTTRPSSGCTRRSARVVAGTRGPGEAVWRGETAHGVNFCGGLHHAMRGAASGFCIYNDAAVGIQWLLDHGVERVAYVDVDVHHGDGVERVFWDDPRVLTVSIHESRPGAVPGHRLARRHRRAGRARGRPSTSRCRPGTGDAGWLRAFHAVVPAGRRAPSTPRCWSPSTAVTRHLPGPAGPPGAVRRRAARGRTSALHAWRTRSATGGGSRSAAAATSSSTWSRARGRTCTAIARAPADPGVRRSRETWRDHVLERSGRRAGPLGDDRRGGPVWWRPWEPGLRPRGRGGPCGHGHPRGRVPAATASTSGSTDRRPRARPGTCCRRRHRVADVTHGA